MKKRILTGIKPTGEIHLGNYIGAIKPTIKLIEGNPDNEIYIFIADAHAINDLKNLKELRKRTLHILATYIACGLDISNKNIKIYKQSDIPAIYELQSLLNNFTPKGLLNSSHAYKVKKDHNIQENLDKNRDKFHDIDRKINVGLYSYPILMASDILIFKPDLVPVGSDQIQHIEIAKDLARKINNYSKNYLKEPKAKYQEDTLLLGLDGRKMSKSYNNTIPLFSTEKRLRKLVKRLATDSTPANDPKPLDSNIVKIFKEFSSLEELDNFKYKLSQGISYNDAKELLFEQINNEIKDFREKYNSIINDENYLINELNKNKEALQNESNRTISELKEKLGFL